MLERVLKTCLEMRESNIFSNLKARARDKENIRADEARKVMKDRASSRRSSAIFQRTGHAGREPPLHVWIFRIFRSCVARVHDGIAPAALAQESLVSWSIVVPTGQTQVYNTYQEAADAGLIRHDLGNLRSRLEGRTPWACQAKDFRNNERGFEAAESLPSGLPEDELIKRCEAKCGS